VNLLRDFTSDSADISAALKQVKLGDSGAAILDAVRYSSRLLERCPKTDRKVILLMSETKDSGSETTESEVLRQIEAGNTMVYSMAYSSMSDSLLGEPTNTQSSVNLLTVFSNIVKATKENVAKTLAQLSGGEYQSFGSERVFEDRIANINNHFFNQYLLSFQPKRPDPGQHTIQVGLRHPAGVNIYARTGYWVQGTVPDQN
jgi:VWFA-related protein